MTEIAFTDAAIDDLRRIGPSAVPKVLKKVLLLLDSPRAGYPLGGDLTGFRKLVVGRNTWRIVYRLVDDKTIEICEIWAVGARADRKSTRKRPCGFRARRASVPSSGGSPTSLSDWGDSPVTWSRLSRQHTSPSLTSLPTALFTRSA